MKQKLLFLLMIYLNITAFAQSTTTVQGLVSAVADKQPIPGVNVILKGSTTGTTTDAMGNFTIEAKEKDVLVFSFIGYASVEIEVGTQTTIDVSLMDDIKTLSEVMIFSTGYEKLPKERATGSFAKVDNELINRRVSTNLLSRIEDVTSGVSFNRGGSAADPISIRGRSTLFANASPLIVIDNFPYDGKIENINPNDVESITVLKDAAAASIWGARAGNGVIVVTTKKGINSTGPKVSFNSNVTIGEKPDAFYVPKMSSADYIETEKQLFAQGYYTSIENSVTKRALTPVVELLIAQRDGKISQEEATQQIEALKQYDVRNDFNKYLYQKSVNQQYAVSINGGSKGQKYFLSTGYDKNLGSLVGNAYERFTFNAKNSWSFIDDKLEVSAELYYTQSKNKNNGLDPASIKMSVYDPAYPYAKLTDEQGNPLSIVQDYRTGFIEQAQTRGLLDWHYRPLEEMKSIDKSSKNTDYRINTNIRYKITEGLSASILYQYWNSNTAGRNHFSEQSSIARNLVNQFTQVSTTGLLIRPIPTGGVLDLANQSSYSNNLRTQLNYLKEWSKHNLSALGGYEIKEVRTTGSSYRYYGYNDELANSSSVDYITQFPQYFYPSTTSRIPGNDSQTDLSDRFISFYANAAYTYNHRYTISASARKDESNLFGVKANQKGVPLWSTGVSWTISEEPFFDFSFLPYLKLRATYGYNGNIDKTVTAYTTAQTYGTNTVTGLPYSRITNPPNPSLQWERIQAINIGLDFELVKNVVNGSIEYYQKNGTDLIGFSPIAPSTGQVRFKGNTAATKAHGVDLVLNSTNIDRAIKWQTNFLFSTSKLTVTDYKDKAISLYLLNYGDAGGYLREGNTLFALYSYKWAGLEPETGDPQGYLNGAVSKDYTAIYTNTKPEDLVYHGSARPTLFGSVRNTFSWNNLSLSFNISYRFGYYFRRSSIIYSNNKGLGGNGDYYNRWQKSGDELITNVPSIPVTYLANRDNIYTYSEALVEKGDHIRFQDIQLSYTLSKSKFIKLPFARAQVYAYANNLGILWKASGKVSDPDYLTSQALRTYSFGFKVDF